MHSPSAISAPARYGFTLLEMSIVLVIIGLLVGGIVGARSYVKNAQLTTMMNETKYFINAFGQFQNNYNNVPGDMPNASDMWTGAHNGDGNGVIRGGTNNTLERFYAFEHLANAGLIMGHYTGATAGGTGTDIAKAGTNVATSAVNRVLYYYDHPDAINGAVATTDSFYYSGSVYFHVLIVGAQTATGTLPPTSFLSPKEAYQLDNKFDDGIPNMGNFMTPKNLTTCTQTAVSTGTVTYNTASSSSQAISCYFFLRIQ